MPSTVHACVVAVVAAAISSVAHTSSATPFDDSILYGVEWRHGVDDALDVGADATERTVRVRTRHADETYSCVVPPSPSTTDGDGVADYDGPTPLDLVRSIYSSRHPCTYRFEAYWQYELCHGKHLLQYHEKKSTLKKMYRQEYVLGVHIDSYVRQQAEKFDAASPPKRKIDESIVPYFPVKYIQGTICDITQTERSTTVIYYCDKAGLNQMTSISETASCEYEVLVPTPTLCRHPAFRPKERAELKIDCRGASDTTPTQPQALTDWEKERTRSFMLQYASWVDIAPTARRDLLVGDGTNQIAIALQPRPGTPAHATPAPRGPVKTPVKPASASTAHPSKPTLSPSDKQVLTQMLTGDACLYGGSGWWMHEFCHEQKVIQYHEWKGESRPRAEILLGVWNSLKHSEWIKRHPHKAPVRDGAIVRQVSHLYSDGNACEETQAPRQVEVRLRCRLPTADLTNNAVTLYLTEPSTCEYVLTVESTLLCAPLQTADAEGLLHFDVNSLK